MAKRADRHFVWFCCNAYFVFALLVGLPQTGATDGRPFLVFGGTDERVIDSTGYLKDVLIPLIPPADIRC
ncbi:hypothetical protein OUZ56_002982 [Daphnia magna]|uniref:Uncharacterized protein n=1 Tax=Daphnia magna TaxID=35525 RepID=A0ABR0A7C9_9CRUS|nr:hypothetical protein OUZ56_002982 [Daphnia magna]